MQTPQLSAPLDPCEQYPGLELLEPMIAHSLRRALSSFRTPTAARARLLNHIARAAGEIEAAVALAKTVTTGPLHRIAGGATA